MSENKNTLFEISTQEETRELNLRDMLATLLLCWKTILICFLAGIAIFALMTMSSSSNATTGQVAPEEAIVSARQAIGEERAQSVERLYERVKFYTNYIDSIEKEYKGFVGYNAQDTSEDLTVLEGYFYVSSEIDNIGSFLSASLLNEEDYDALRSLSHVSSEAEIYERVQFPAFTTATSVEVNETDNSRQYVLPVILYGSTEEQCEDMFKVVEHAIEREAAALRKVDPELRLETICSRFTGDARALLRTQQDIIWKRYTDVDWRLTDQKGKVNALISTEKAFYDLLIQQDGVEQNSVEQSSGGVSKKGLAIGGLLGLFVGIVIVFWTYLFDGRIKTADELEHTLHTMVLNRVNIKGKKNLFGKLAAGLMDVNSIDPNVKSGMIAADLRVMMEKNGKKRAYLICSEEDKNAAAVAEQVKMRLQEKFPEANIAVGNPLSSIEELERIGEAELSVAFVELKKSRRNVLRQWRQICNRYCLPMAGTVSVQKCW